MTASRWKGAEPGESERDFSRRLAGELEALILAEGPDTVAAFIAERVRARGGAIVLPSGYFEAIGAVCARYGTCRQPTRQSAASAAPARRSGPRPSAIRRPRCRSPSSCPRLPAAVDGGDQHRHGRDDRGQLGKIGTLATASPTAATGSPARSASRRSRSAERLDMPGRVRGLAPRLPRTSTGWPGIRWSARRGTSAWSAGWRSRG